MTKLESLHGYYLWTYVPSLGAAVVMLLVFLVCTAPHIWKVYQTRLWFCGVFALGGVFEVIGYIGRCAAHSSTTAIGPFVVQNIFILIAPTLFAASIYMTLGRIIRSVGGDHLSPISPRRLTWAFLSGDIVSFVVQGNSAAVTILGYPFWSNVMVIGGLSIQLVSFALFGLTALVFGRRIRRSPTPSSASKEAVWTQSLNMLYAVSVLILIRSTFRIIEFAMGQSGYLLRHEWTMYIFDSVLMAAVMVIFYVWYPSNLEITKYGERDISLIGSYRVV